MKHLLITVAAAALLVSCGKKAEDPADVGAGVERAGNAAMDSANRALNDLGNITLRRGNAANATAALTAMSLAQSGSGRVEFAGTSRNDDGATFSDVAISLPADDDGDVAQMIIGTMELDGLDMVNGQASFSKLALSDVRIVPDSGDDDADSEISVADIELLNPSPALAAWVASLGGNGEPAEFPKAADLGFDSWTLSNFLARSTEDGEDAEVSISSVQLGGAREGKMEVAMLKDFQVNAEGDEGEPVTIGLKSLSMTGAALDILSGSFLAGFREGSNRGDDFASTLMEQVYANPMEPGYDSVAAEALTFSMGGVDFNLPSYTALVTRNRQGQAVGGETLPFSATLSADPEAGKSGAELAGALGMMGYEAITISGAGKSSFDPATDAVRFAAADNYFALEDGFTLRFGGNMSGVSGYMESLKAMNVDGQSLDDKALERALASLKINAFNFSLEDQSIIDRAINLYAAQSNEDPAMVRQQATMGVAMLPFLAAQAGVDPSIATELSTGLTTFLQEGGTLTIDLKPATPLSMATFANMEDPRALTKDTLGLTVTHK